MSASVPTDPGRRSPRTDLPNVVGEEQLRCMLMRLAVEHPMRTVIVAANTTDRLPQVVRPVRSHLLPRLLRLIAGTGQVVIRLIAFEGVPGVGVSVAG